jgi:hypothetical protein
MMQNLKEAYRQRMIGQLQLWEGQIAAIWNSIDRLEPEYRLDAIRRYQELERYHREVFGRFEDLLLSGEDEWDIRRQALDESGDALQFVLDTFHYQPA